MKWVRSVALAALLASAILAGCTAQSADRPPSPAETSTEPKPAPATSAAPTTEPATEESSLEPATDGPTAEEPTDLEGLTSSDPGAIPARSDQSPEETAELTDIYLRYANQNERIQQSTNTDEGLILFANRFCDLLDEGDGWRISVSLVAVVTELDYGDDTSVPYLLAHNAVFTICPEHHDYDRQS